MGVSKGLPKVRDDFMEFVSRRSPVLGRRGMVACTQPLASEASPPLIFYGLIVYMNDMFKMPLQPTCHRIDDIIEDRPRREAADRDKWEIIHRRSLEACVGTQS